MNTHEQALIFYWNKITNCSNSNGGRTPGTDTVQTEGTAIVWVFSLKTIILSHTEHCSAPFGQRLSILLAQLEKTNSGPTGLKSAADYKRNMELKTTACIFMLQAYNKNQVRFPLKAPTVIEARLRLLLCGAEKPSVNIQSQTVHTWWQIGLSLFLLMHLMHLPDTTASHRCHTAPYY